VLGPRIPTGAFTLLVGVDVRYAGIVVETGSVAPYTAQYEWTTNGGQTWQVANLPWAPKRYPHLFGTRRLQESDISRLDFAFRREKLFWKISGDLKGFCVWTAN
jgi:hypothetical protein